MSQAAFEGLLDSRLCGCVETMLCVRHLLRDGLKLLLVQPA